MNTTRGLVFAMIIGLLFVGIGVFLFMNHIQSEKNGIHAVGRVVDIKTRWSGRNLLYMAVIEFRTPDGAAHRLTSGFATSWRPTIGGSANVVYQPGLPNTAVEDSAFMAYVLPGLSIFTGMLTVAFVVNQLRKKSLTSA